MLKDVLLLELKNSIITWLKEAGVADPVVTVEHPSGDLFGEYTTNTAMRYAGELKKNPFDLAEELASYINSKNLTYIERVEAVKPGFLNFYMTKTFFSEQMEGIVTYDRWGSNMSLSGKKVMIEYTQPNPFKPFHIGHLMSNAIGESLSRIVSFSGADVLRVNYQGDVGPHVAKAVWMLLKKGKPKETLSNSEKASYIGQCYVEANAEYENDPEVKTQIDLLNKKIYERSDEEINAVYDWGKEVTLAAFEDIYTALGTKFDHYYFESEMAPVGMGIVEENIGEVFEKSDGATVFPADKYDPKLHTRVFVNSKGLPTYETKEIGLTITKFKNHEIDQSIVITALEQSDYMRVVEKVISILYPEYAKRMTHIAHGMMRFADGKMSSRTGNVITGESLLDEAYRTVMEKISDRDFTSDSKEKIAQKISIGAVKYSILRQDIGFNIIYDFESSISFEGDSGPYLQYATVRSEALLAKAKTEGIVPSSELPPDWEVTMLERLLYRFPEVVEKSYVGLSPHHVAVYLTGLSSAFNRFYGQGKIVSTTDNTSPYKVLLTQAFSLTMKNGLALLGIETVDEM